METERLIIHSPTKEDVQALKAIHNSEYVLKYNCMTPYNDQQTLQQILKDQQSDTVFYLYHKQDRHLIGAVYFGEDDLRYGANSLSLSYYLSENDAGQGYMSEALKMLVPFIFNQQNPDVLSCRIFKDNIASRRLIEKLGFVYEGCLQHAVRAYSGIIYDDCLYALYKSDK